MSDKIGILQVCIITFCSVINSNYVGYQIQRHVQGKIALLCYQSPDRISLKYFYNTPSSAFPIAQPFFEHLYSCLRTMYLSTPLKDTNVWVSCNRSSRLHLIQIQILEPRSIVNDPYCVHPTIASTCVFITFNEHFLVSVSFLLL